MKLLYSLLLFAVLSLNMSAQQTTPASAVKDTAYVNTYNKLRALYLKQLDSESHKKAQKISMAFMQKTKFDGDFSILREENGMLNWIKENLDKTSFLSYDEAVKEYKEQDVAFEADSKENAEYYDFMKIANEKYPKIAVDVMLNRGTGEDPKESKEYKAAHDKFKQLMTKQMASKSYLKVNSLESEFRTKANFIPKKDKLERGKTIFDWVIQNFSKTMFKSINEAEMEWNIIEFAKEAEKKENAEYYEFQSDVLHKYGPEMYSDVMIEVMTAE